MIVHYKNKQYEFPENTDKDTALAYIARKENILPELPQTQENNDLDKISLEGVGRSIGGFIGKAVQYTGEMINTPFQMLESATGMDTKGSQIPGNIIQNIGRNIVSEMLPGQEDTTFGADIATGAMNTMKGIYSYGEALSETTGIHFQKGIQKLDKAIENLAPLRTPEDKRLLINDLMEGVGSMLPLAAGGTFGVGLYRFGVSKFMSGLAANALATGLESASEAGGVYEEAVKRGDPDAALRAHGNFAYNVILLGITNQLGYFGETAKGFKKLFTNSLVMEAGQEFSQSVGQDIALGDKVNLTKATYEGILGGILGYGAGKIIRPTSKTPIDKPEVNDAFNNMEMQEDLDTLKNTPLERVKAILEAKNKTPQTKEEIAIYNILNADTKLDLETGSTRAGHQPEVAPNEIVETIQKVVDIKQELSKSFPMFSNSVNETPISKKIKKNVQITEGGEVSADAKITLESEEELITQAKTLAGQSAVNDFYSDEIEKNTIERNIEGTPISEVKKAYKKDAKVISKTIDIYKKEIEKRGKKKKINVDDVLNTILNFDQEIKTTYEATLNALEEQKTQPKTNKRKATMVAISEGTETNPENKQTDTQSTEAEYTTNKTSTRNVLNMYKRARAIGFTADDIKAMDYEELEKIVSEFESIAKPVDEKKQVGDIDSIKREVELMIYNLNPDLSPEAIKSMIEKNTKGKTLEEIQAWSKTIEKNIGGIQTQSGINENEDILNEEEYGYKETEGSGVEDGAVDYFMSKHQNAMPINQETAFPEGAKNELKQIKNGLDLIKFMYKYSQYIRQSRKGLLHLYKQGYVQNILKNIKIIITQGENQTGVYYEYLDDKGKIVDRVIELFVNKNTSLNYMFNHTIPHEIIHGLTVSEYRTNRKFKTTIDNLFNIARKQSSKRLLFLSKNINKLSFSNDDIITLQNETYSHDEYQIAYGLQEQTEFIAQAFSSTPFQKHLSNIKAEQKKTGIVDVLKLFVSSISQFVTRNSISNSLLHDIIFETEKVIMNKQKTLDKKDAKKAVTIVKTNAPQELSKKTQEKIKKEQAKQTKEKAKLNPNSIQGSLYLSIVDLGISFYKQGYTNYKQWNRLMKSMITNKLDDAFLGRVWLDTVDIMNYWKKNIDILQQYGDPDYIVSQRNIKTTPLPPVTQAERNMISRIKGSTIRLGGKYAVKTFDSFITEIDRTFNTNFRHIFLGAYEDSLKHTNRHYNSIMNKAEEIMKKHNLNSKNFERIGIAATIVQPGGLDAIVATGKENELVMLEDLSSGEKEMYDYMRTIFDQLFTQYNQARAVAGHDPIKYIKDYFTFSRIIQEQGDEHILDSHYKYFQQKIQTYFPYAKNRTKNENPIELNAMKLFNLYAKRATKYIHTTPVLSKMKEVINDQWIDENEKRRGLLYQNPNLYNDLSHMINYFTTGKTSEKLGYIGGIDLDKAINTLRRNTGSAVMIASPRLSVTQIFQLMGTISAIKHIASSFNGISQWLSQEGKQIADKSKVIEIRVFDQVFEDIDMIVNEIESSMDSKVKKSLKNINAFKNKYGSIVTTFLDKISIQVGWHMLYQDAIASNKTQQEAIRYADEYIIKTQGSFATPHQAMIQTHTLGRALTLFNTFVIHRFNWIKDDMIKPIFKPNQQVSRADAIKQGIKLIIALMLTNWLAEEIFGIRSPEARPIKAFQAAIEDGAEIDEAILKSMVETLTLVPIIGGGLKYSGSPYGAAAQIPIDAMKTIGSKVGTYSGYTPPFYETIFKVAGVPLVATAIADVALQEQGINTFNDIPIIGKILPDPFSDYPVTPMTYYGRRYANDMGFMQVLLGGVDEEKSISAKWFSDMIKIREE